MNMCECEAIIRDLYFKIYTFFLKIISIQPRQLGNRSNIMICITE